MSSSKKFTTVFERLQKANLTFSSQDLNQIGRMLSVVYRKLHKKDPPKVMHEELGKIINVNAYTYSDTPLIDKTTHRFYKKKLRRLLDEKNKSGDKVSPEIIEQIRITTNNIAILFDKRNLSKFQRRGDTIGK